MGRTIHYSITKERGSFTRKELDSIYNVSVKYNTGNYANAWTCENFFCHPFDHYPNWQGKYKGVNADEAWKDIKKNIDQLIHEGNHYFDAILTLNKRGDVILHNGIPKNVLRGFTKVQGNELNSLMVLMALTEISEQVPSAEINLSDEGEFLLCDLKIKSGKAMPLIESLMNDIKRYCHLMMFSEKYEGNILAKLNYTSKDFTHEFQMDYELQNGYGDMTKYVNDKLRNLKEIENALLKAGVKGNELYLFNLQNRNHTKWFNPYIFSRHVEVEKFVDYKRTTATLMDGFSGEGFSLTNEDAEAKSYHSIAQIQKMFDNPNLELKILGEG